MEEQEFTIGSIKLLSDEHGYGIAHQTDEGVWEVIANFKYPGNFISYLGLYFSELSEKASSLQTMVENIDIIYNNSKEEENNG